MDDEKQTCGRRMQEYGSWERKENLDIWKTDRWGSRKSDKWNWPWKPRTCSFCGSIHPEDAIKLLKEGWEIETTGKSYKRYLEPPGYKEMLKRFRDKIRQKDEPFDDKGAWTPTPPVKLYTMHFDQEERNLFNIEINKRKNKDGESKN